jgi:hypothetical protein
MTLLLDPIDITKLAEESANCPYLYGQYLHVFNELSAKHKFIESEYKILYLQKWRWYQGKSSAEEYKDSRPPEKISKGDVSMYIDADEEVVLLKRKMLALEIECKSQEKLLKEIGTRSFHIRNIIEYMKFQEGQ